MRKLRYLLLGAFALTVSAALRGAVSAPATEQSPASFRRDVVPFLKQHCYRCHGNGKDRGDLALDKYTDDESILKDRKVWENVLHVVRTGEMPPKKRPRPSAAEIETVLRAIDGVFASADCAQTRNPGRVTLRRLNKTEYNNTIRDLVGIDFQPAADFPADDVGYGFDNIGDVLSLSPLLLERYLLAADAILDRALVVVDPPKPAKTRLGSLRVFPPDAGEIRRRGGAVLRSSGRVGGQSFFEEGEYTIRIEAYGEQAGDEPVRGGAANQPRRHPGIHGQGRGGETGDVRVQGPPADEDGPHFRRLRQSFRREGQAETTARSPRHRAGWAVQRAAAPTAGKSSTHHGPR